MGLCAPEMLSVMRKDIDRINSRLVLEDFENWFVNQKLTVIDHRNGRLLVGVDDVWKYALDVYKEEHNDEP